MSYHLQFESLEGLCHVTALSSPRWPLNCHPASQVLIRIQDIILAVVTLAHLLSWSR